MTYVWPDHWRGYIEYGIYETFADDEDDADIPLIEAVRIVERAIFQYIELDVLPLLAFGHGHDPTLAHGAIKAILADIDRNPLPLSLPDCVLDPAIWEVLQETEDSLRKGLAEDAAHRLRLLTRPKYPSLPHCVAAHAKAMGEVYGPPAPPAPQAILPFEDTAP